MAERFELFVFLLDLTFEESDSLFLFFDQFGEVSGAIGLGGGLEVGRGRAFNGDVTWSELNGFGFAVLSAEPFFRGQSSLTGEGRGVKVVLEDVRFTGDRERDGLDGVLGDFKETSDFARGGVEAGLGEKGHTALRVVRLVLRQVEQIRIFLDGLEVTDVTVSLTGEVKDVDVVVVEGHQNT